VFSVAVLLVTLLARPPHAFVLARFVFYLLPPPCPPLEGRSSPCLYLVYFFVESPQAPLPPAENFFPHTRSPVLPPRHFVVDLLKRVSFFPFEERKERDMTFVDLFAGGFFGPLVFARVFFLLGRLGRMCAVSDALSVVLLVHPFGPSRLSLC